eukprot:TRINITY_DN8740_c0_g1_i1.p2 TRINITY_DN8740_c0_g1~~TRINITY_DN8740_c0_g1_i1.p2  ORF type:complete len:131 (+),score=26.47 TRINITY_DN8740_c0_g1_i1:127-519(+)
MGGTLGPQQLLVSAFLVAVGATFHILACEVVGDNAYPLIVMFMYLFAPLPFFLCASSQQDMFTTEGGGLGVIGNFLFGMFGASGPCLTMVLMHSGVITDGAGAMSLAGGVCIALATLYAHRNMKDDMGGF